MYILLSFALVLTSFTSSLPFFDNTYLSTYNNIILHLFYYQSDLTLKLILNSNKILIQLQKAWIL